MFTLYYYVLLHCNISNMNGVRAEDWISFLLYDSLSGEREVLNWLTKRRLILNNVLVKYTVTVVPSG